MVQTFLNNEQEQLCIDYPEKSWHKLNKLSNINMQEVYSSSWSISVTGAEGFSLCCTQTAGTTKSIAYSQRLGSDADINAGSKPQFKRTYFKCKFKNYLLITQYIKVGLLSVTMQFWKLMYSTIDISDKVEQRFDVQ